MENVCTGSEASFFFMQDRKVDPFLTIIIIIKYMIIIIIIYFINLVVQHQLTNLHNTPGAGQSFICPKRQCSTLSTKLVIQGVMRASGVHVPFRRGVK